MSPTGLLKKHSKVIALCQRFLDVILIAATYLGAKLFWSQPIEPRSWMLLFSAIMLFMLFANMAGLYRSWRVERFWAEYRIVLLVYCCVVLGLLVLGYATKTTAHFSRLTLGTWILLVPLALFLERIGVRMLLGSLRSHGYNTRKVAIVGTGRVAQSLAREIQANDWMGLEIAGFFANDPSQRVESDDFGVDNFGMDGLGMPQFAGDYDDDNVRYSVDVPVAGSLKDLIDAARAHQLDEIYIAMPARSRHLVTALVSELSNSSVPVCVVPDLFTLNLINAQIVEVGTVPMVSIFQSPLDEVGVVLKRAEDIVLATMILLMIAGPMLAIAIGIKLTSRGPVLFKQRRYGLKGEEIQVWKFRSMTVMEDGNTVRQAGRNDARITPFGAFLRRTSLDELPQFINVLQGSMSIVGPRPHAVAHNEQYRRSIEGYMLRHLVKPGITGWAQVNGWRGETDTREKMEKRVEYDLHYLRHWSLELDLRIIVMTVFKGFINRNAY